MTEVRYAVFETAATPTRWRNTFRTGADVSSSPQPTTVKLISDKEAETVRAQGKEPMRVPKMPVRLIPQVANVTGAGNGQPWGIAAVGADRPSPAGEGVRVAVLDTGIDPTHPAFKGLIRKDNYEDFTGTGLTDYVGHGTHCAGIIFGRSVNGVRIGVAPGVANVLIGKIADRNFATTTDQLQQALNWAVGKGAEIISLSVGLDFLGHSKALQRTGMPEDAALVAALNDYRDYTRFFDRLMNLIVSAGAAGRSALVIAASGNDSHADQARPYRVAATLPAVAEKVIAVGALGRAAGSSLTVAPFSNTAVNICAPGVDILSAAPNGGYATMSGTSQAAPHVAGVAALWWQVVRQEIRGQPTPDSVRERLIGAAKKDRIAGEPNYEEVGAGLAVAPP